MYFCENCQCKVLKEIGSPLFRSAACFVQAQLREAASDFGSRFFCSRGPSGERGRGGGLLQGRGKVILALSLALNC